MTPDANLHPSLPDSEVAADRLLIHSFEAWAAAAPAAAAVECEGQSLSYAQLNSLANQLAQVLADRGIGRGDYVVLALPASADCLAVLLAVAKTGAAYAPVGCTWPAARIAAVIDALGPKLVVHADPVGHELRAARCVSISELVASAAQTRAAEQNFGVALAPSDLCYVMHTSGTTGRPKGVQVTHQNLAAMYAASGIDWASGLDGEQHKWSWLHSLAFGYSAWEIWGALAHGGCVVVVPEALRQEPVRWSKLVTDAGVTMLSLTPSALRQLGETDLKRSLQPGLVFLSGEALRHDDLPVLRRVFTARATRFINLYALTETAGRVALKELHGNETEADSLIGQPAPDVEVFIVDSDTLRPAEVGELLIAGPMLSPGYINDPALNAQKFVTYAPADGLPRRCYRSGDQARRNAQGELEILGRIDAQLKLHGYRIEPADVEAVLRQHSQVADIAVTVVSAASGAEQLAAAVVRASEANQTLEFWPSLGEHLLYDELLYDFMAADQVRIDSYQAAFAQQVRDQVVLDIGTGRHAVLARLCAAAGARKVYAVEILADAAAAARALVAELGLSEQIEVLCGDIRNIVLPEKVTICTQGIVGNIGSSDGIVPLWNAARQFFAADARAVPEQCITLFAPGELPADASTSPAYPLLARQYLERLYQAQGAPFDPRLCVRNFSPGQLLAAAATFETLDFSGALADELADQHEFVVERAGRFDGLLLWTRLLNDGVEPVDFLAHQQAWLPVWLPVEAAGVALQAGDRICAQWSRTTAPDTVFPDYEINARVLRAEQVVAELAFRSPQQPTGQGHTALHRQLAENSPADTSADLVHYAAEQLPRHMQPSRWAFVDRLPVNANGKLDRMRLVNLFGNSTGSTSPISGIADAFEADIAEIWKAVLGREIGPQEDFFAAGGDSILAVRLTTEVQNYLDDAVFLAALFDAPTLTAYCDFLRHQHTAAVDKRLAARQPGPQGTAVAEAASGALSHAQQSLWFLQQLYPDSSAANEQFVIRMDAHPDVDQLRRAWQELMQRHPIFQMVFSDQDGEPVQQPGDRLALLDELLDWRDRQPAAADADLLALATTEMRRCFDLAAGPLLRPLLVLMPGDTALILATAHHIIADGLTVPILARELALLYTDGGAALAAPAMQFSDHVQMERALLTREFVAAEAAWWQQQLAGVNAVPLLPTPPQPAERPLASRFALTISADVAGRLRAIGQHEKASSFMVLLAAWRIWLARCLNNDDVLVGTPMTLRKDSASAALAGCMVNNIALRNALTGVSSFREALRNERRQVLAEWEHSVLPFDRVVEAVAPARVIGRHPLFQAMYFYSEPPPAVHGFTTDVLPVPRDSFWDVDLTVTDCGSGAGFELVVSVRDDLMDPDTSKEWMQGLTEFLSSIAANPDVQLSDLPLAAARDQAPEAIAQPLPESLYAAIAAVAARRPRQPAVRDVNETLSYAALLAQADCYCAGLQAAGVGAGDVVGVAVPRSAQMIALLIAINRAGATWLALDPAWPQERIRLMLADTRPALLVAAPDAGVMSADSLSAAGGLRSMTLAELHGSATAAVTRAPAEHTFVLFTSGSTGKPKGAAMPAAGVLNRCLWMWEAFGFASDACFAQRSSLNFVDSAWEIFGPLLHGARLSVMPEAYAADAAKIRDWLADEGITHLVTVPALLDGLLQENLSTVTLRSVISSGEALLPDTLKRFQQALPDCMLLNTYGATEFWDATCARVDQLDVTKLSRVPIGYALPGMRCDVVNAHGQLLPPGVPGELRVSGINVAASYIANADLSAERFSRDANGQMSYLTGDLALRRADGMLELIGRVDRQFKLNGIRIEPTDIESNARAHRGVGRAAVVVQQTAGLTVPVLFAEALDADQLSVQELRAFLSAHLPNAMIPGDIRLLESWPVTPSGKTDLQALIARLEGAEAVRDFIAPATATEVSIAQTWSEILGLSNISADDDFFALGGHSLLATRVIARLADQFQLDLPLKSLFEQRTVASLAANIDALRSLSAAPASVDGSQPREVFRL